MRRTKLNLGRHSAALRAAKLMCDEISPISARRCSRNSFKVPQFPSLNIQYTLKLRSSLPTSFVMAALESISFVPFAIPPSNPPFCNRNTLWHDQTSPSIRSDNVSGGQKTRKSADPLSRSGYQADRNEAARAQGMWKSSTRSESPSRS